MDHQRQCRIDRRQFGCQAISTAIVGVGCAAQGERTSAEVLKETSSFSLNYILGSPMYGTAPLAEVLAEAKTIGAGAVDLWPKPHADHREQLDTIGLDKFQRLLDENDVKLGMITRYDLGPYQLADEIKLLTTLGGKLVVCGAKPQAGDTLREQVAKFVESMKPHVTVAEQQGVMIGIENHAGSLLSSPDSIKYFADLATSPHLGLAMAPYHLPQNPDTIAALIRHLDKPNLAFFQAWQHGNGCMKKLPKTEEMLQLPGLGPLDFRPIVAALRQIDYDGWTEIFMHPVPRGIPIRRTSAEVSAEINRARNYLSRCLESNADE